jgi:hypothetical protein
MSSTVKMLDHLNLSAAELTELTEALLQRERKKARRDAPVVADLLVSYLRVGRFEDTSLVTDAENLLKKIREQSK